MAMEVLTLRADPLSVEGPVFYLADSVRVQGPTPKFLLDPMPLPSDLEAKLNGIGLEFQHSRS